MKQLWLRFFSLLFCGLLISSCQSTDPLESSFPSLPPTGGPAIAHAGQLTTANFETERVTGPASQGLVGDYFLKNDKIRVVIQAPGRAIGPCPFGGNIIDADFVSDPAGDQLGEISPVFHFGRTFSVDRSEVVRDGSLGGPAVVRFYGHDARNDYVNLPGLNGFFFRQSSYNREELSLRTATTYILMPGETKVRIVYSFHNTQSQREILTIWGTLTDTGAAIEIFHPYYGFGEIPIDAIIGSANSNRIPSPTDPSLFLPAATYYGLQGDHISYGLVPRDGARSFHSSFIPTAGVVIEFYNTEGLADVLAPRDDQWFFIPPQKAESREVDLLLARDTAGVTEQKHALLSEETVAFSGSVEGASAGVRVAINQLDVPRNFQYVSTAITNENGRFRGALPPGRYSFQAEAEGWRRGVVVDAILPGNEIRLSVPTFGKLAYTIKDNQGNFIPGKVIVVGNPANPGDLRFRDVSRDKLPLGIAAWAHSLSGQSASSTHFDAPITIGPGKYRVVVSRGPEWSRSEDVVTVTEGNTTTVNSVLYHVAPTPGYLAADFHQHSHISPDAYAAPEERIASYLADGVDLISSSEHDVIFDYKPLIDRLGVGQLLDSMIGVESTPWDYGHYIGFPFAVDPNSPNGGAVDWAGGELNPGLTPPLLFEAMRQRGARVIQVNHPRGPAGSFFSFQKSFDRAGLRFDFENRTFFGDTNLSSFPDSILDLPDGSARFSPTFDLVEVFNGSDHEQVRDAGGERHDQTVDTILHDWMNFLSFGYAPTPSGVSDAHTRLTDPGGLPRTLVRVPDDSQAAIGRGTQDAVIATLTGRGVPRDVIVTNTPFIRLTVDGKGIGQLVTHAAKAAPIRVQVQVMTPMWAPIDTIEIFSNNTFEIPTPGGTEAQPLVPALCFTTKTADKASPRCKMAIGGARPMTVAITQALAGDSKSARLEATVEADVAIADLLMRQRVGARGEDLWLVARTFGDVGLFPVIPHISETSKASVSNLVENLNLAGIGVPALAFTNAIFVDVDGGGWKGPFQP